MHGEFSLTSIYGTFFNYVEKTGFSNLNALTALVKVLDLQMPLITIENFSSIGFN